MARVVTQAGEQGYNVTRTALLSAGFPESVPGTTIDRQCGSSQQAATFAAQGVIAGSYDIVIACGVESMSRAPLGSSLRAGQDPSGRLLHERCPSGLVGQGVSAELITRRWGLTRTELDEYAARSHRLAADAAGRGDFDGSEHDKLALLLGAEGEGLTEDALAASDSVVQIPMKHGIDSLNVAAASAVAMWALSA